MKNLYITQSGSLKRKDNTLLFKNESVRKVIPIQGIETIYALGELSVNSKLLVFLQQNKISMHFFNYYGFYSGSFYPKESYVSGNLLVKQVEHYQNIELRASMARRFVRGIEQNIKSILRHYIKHGKSLKKKSNRIKFQADKLDECKTINQILMIEGGIWDIFYSCLNEILDDAFDFTNRVKRPPDNPINALISFGNSMLYTKVLSMIYFTQLNPTISYLHKPFERRFSLALDLAEVFKPSLVYQTIFKLINKKMLRLEHFDEKINYCYLKEEGRKIFVAEFDNKLNKTTKHKILKRKVSNQTSIKLECYKLIKHFLKEKEYCPFNLSKGF